MLTLFGWFFGLLAIGLPVALVLGGTAIVYMTTVADLPLRIVPQRLFAGLDQKARTRISGVLDELAARLAGARSSKASRAA